MLSYILIQDMGLAIVFAANFLNLLKITTEQVQKVCLFPD
jgi:hypothetical protein